METIFLDWDDFKTDIINKGFPLNFKRKPNGYDVFALDRTLTWTAVVSSPSGVADFETNYQSNCNRYLDPVDDGGKAYVRAEVRPMECTTMFTSRGDTVNDIGDGERTSWNSADPSGWTTEGAPSGYKQLTKDLQFMDPIFVTAGCCMYENCPFGSELDMYVMYEAAPGYFVPVDHFVSAWPMSGTCSEGSTIDSTTISSALPPYLVLRFIYTIPENETSARGAAALKIYRERTVIS